MIYPGICYLNVSEELLLALVLKIDKAYCSGQEIAIFTQWWHKMGYHCAHFNRLLIAERPCAQGKPVQE